MGALISTPVFAAEDLELHCPGSGLKTSTETATVNSFGKSGDDKEKSTTVIQNQTKVPFDGTFELKIAMGSAKVRVPDALRPTLGSGKRDSWIDVSDLEMNDREIKGTFRFNFANKPKFRVDRLTGEVHVSGVGAEFTGNCQKVDAAAERKF